MLFLPPASSRFLRLHGPYISEQESARLASFLRKQGRPTYDETITAEDEKTGGAIELEKDDLYDEAARIVVQSGQVSISYLQRKMRIGFSRAARLVDMMEAEVWSRQPPVGSRVRCSCPKSTSRRWTRSCADRKPHAQCFSPLDTRDDDGCPAGAAGERRPSLRPRGSGTSRRSNADQKVRQSLEVASPDAPAEERTRLMREARSAIWAYLLFLDRFPRERIQRQRAVPSGGAACGTLPAIRPAAGFESLR
jgi:hypothetical protein